MSKFRHFHCKRMHLQILTLLTMIVKCDYGRTKLKQTEVDCEFLKRCCENLTEENRRLQKEVQELRALKQSPQLYMQMTPPTTLTMCPSCERVGGQSQNSQSGRVKQNENHWTVLRQDRLMQ